MKILLLLVAGLGGLVALLALAGALLPRTHVATRVASFSKSPAELYAIVRAFDQAATWRSGVKAIELLPPRDGRPMFREQTAHNRITYEVLEDRPGEKLVTRIADQNLPYGGTWTFEFAATGTGATLRITEEGVIRNVIFRCLARFVFGHTRTIETYLSDLRRKLGETAAPGR